MGQSNTVVEEGIMGYGPKIPMGLTFLQYRLISALNYFTWRETDCHRTFDFMLEKEKEVKELLRQCTYNDIFEVSLRLNDKGIYHLRYKFLFDIRDNLTKNKWDYWQLIDSIKDVYFIKTGKDPRPDKKYI